MLRIFLYFIFVLTNILCYADYSDRGRPSDFQEHHDGPLAYLFMGVGVIIVLGLIGIWIYDKIRTHKEQISNTIGTMFAALLIFGGMLIFGKCGEAVHNSINSKEKNEEQINSNVNSFSSTPTSPAPNHPIQQYTAPVHTPTIHYRTVEYYENCYNCSGSGQTLCPRCHGTGNFKKTCSRCNGSGGHYKSRCVYCSGKGYTEDDVFGTGKHSCFSCNGTGYNENNCQWCSGTGYETEICDIYAAYGSTTHKVTCSICNGSGKIIKTRQESYYE